MGIPTSPWEGNEIMSARRTTVVRLFGVKILAVCAAMGMAVSAIAQTTPPRTTTAPAARQGQQAAPAEGGRPIVVAGLEPGGTSDIKLLVNKSRVVTTSRPYRRISVGQPDIIEANAIGPTKILVTAKSPGSTQLIVWDEADESQMIDVLVQSDLRALREMYPTLFPGSRIDVVSNEGTIALTGRVPNLETAEQAATLASSFGGKVLNLLEVAGGQQILLQVRFAEVSRQALSQLGVNLNAVNGSGFGGTNIGGFNNAPLYPGTGIVGANPNLINGMELTGERLLNPAVTLFGGGQIGSFYFETLVQTLRRNNLGRVLAEPNLIATSGQEAYFLAGGEFPIPIAQGGAGASGNLAITVEFKVFGVQLTFVPVALGDGKIRMRVTPEVSDLDFGNSIVLSGATIPGLTTRKVSTTVELAEGQTFAIAGLLNNAIAANKDVIPLLGDLPVLGTLFRSVRYQKRETELVVLVTPRLVAPMKPGQVPQLPGERWRNPSEAQLFLNQDLGGPAKEKEVNEPVRPFIGRYGFAPATQPAKK
jgi:pilus assembly protein CpaC